MDTLIKLWHLWHDELIELSRVFVGEFEEFSEFMIIYPFALSVLWTIYGMWYLYNQRRILQQTFNEGHLPSYSVVIPYYAEFEAALQTARSLCNVSPKPVEIVIVDDASPQLKDSKHIELPDRTRIVRLKQRQGKAAALNTALRILDSEIIVCMDADSLPASRNWRLMLRHFLSPHIAAVTGKIQPHKCHNLLERLQHLDYVAVICLIKAAETTWGGLMTVSGAFVAYRRSALRKLGGWNEDTATEDIDLSWRLQTAGWHLAYESLWCARVQMAPTITALWRQRRRWGMGLGRAARDHLVSTFTAARATHVAVAIVLMFNWLWLLLTIISLCAGIVLLLSDTLFAQTELSRADRNWLHYFAVAWPVFLLQYAVAAYIYKLAWRDFISLLPLTLVYPLYFWIVLFTSFITGFPVGMTHNDSGVWQRTDRQKEYNRRKAGKS